MSQNKKGILYLATGEKYRSEALCSAEVVKKICPDLPIAIITDYASEPIDNMFSFVIELEEPSFSFRDKTWIFEYTPFNWTLFIDTDAYIMEPIDEIFDLLQNFDLSITIDAYGDNPPYCMAPSSFPELNTGVILFKKNRELIKLGSKWRENYDLIQKKELPNHSDQGAFRNALLESCLRFSILPNEFNAHDFGMIFLRRGSRAKIVHTKCDPVNLHFLLNSVLEQRIFIPDTTSIKAGSILFNEQPLKLIFRILKKIHDFVYKIKMK